MDKFNKPISWFKKIPLSTYILTSLIVFFIIVNVVTINHWYFSVIGDEYSFYIFAKNFNLLKLNLFSQSGVYGNHPVLSSVYQALVMKILGDSNFAWRFSSLLIVPLSIPGLYLIGKELFNKNVGLFSAIIFSSSFYLFGYAHTGYNNIQALFPFIYGVYMAIKGYKKNATIYYVLSGFFCALGWYTFYTSRITILLVSIIFALKLIKKNNRSENIKNFAFLLIVFFLITTPLIITNKEEVITKMLDQSILNREYYGTFIDNPTKRFLINFKKNFFSFILGNDLKHFVSAPILDPISKILALIGLSIAIKNIRKLKYSLLLIFYVLLTIMVSFNPLNEIAISRIHLNLSILTIFGGIGWHFTNKLISKKSGQTYSVILALSILILNIYTFYYEIPRKFPLNKEALIIKAAQTSSIPLIIHEGQNENKTFRKIIEAYDFKQDVFFLNSQTKQINLPKTTFLYVSNDKKTNKMDINLLKSCHKANSVRFFAPNKNIWLEALKCKK